jgi:TolA-binding protein
MKPASVLYRSMRRVFLGCLCICVVYAGTVHGEEENPAGDYADAIAAYEEGRFRDAKDLFSRYVRDYPDDPHASEALYHMAMCEPVASKSISLFDEYIERYPEGTRVEKAHLHIAEYHYALGEYLTARDRLRRYIDSHPAGRLRDRAMYCLARCYLALNDFSTSLIYFRKVVNDFPASSLLEPAYLGIGDSQYKMTNFKDAEKTYRDALERFPEGAYTSLALFKRGMCLERLGRTDGAVDLYRTLEEKYAGTTEYVEAKRRIELIAQAEEERRMAEAQGAVAPQEIAVNGGEAAGTITADTDARTTGGDTDAGSTGTSPEGDARVSGDTCFTVQVGAFTNVANATNLRAKLENRGYDSEVYPRQIGGRKLFSVWVGRCLSEQEALKMGGRLQKDEGLNFRVVRREDLP